MAVERFTVVSRWRPAHALLFASFLGLLGFAYFGGVVMFRRTELGSIIPFAMLVVGPFAIALALALYRRSAVVHEFSRRFAAGDVVVGRDGIRLSELDGRRFVRFDELADVTIGDLAVILRDTSGKTVSLTVWTGSVDDDATKRRALFEAIERGRAATKSRAGTDDAAAQLARNGRDVGAWVGFARDLGRGGSGYRVPTTQREDLWRIVEDGGVEDDARVAAALALRVSADETERSRLAAVAEDTVSPRVRIGLEMDADDEAIAEAITLASRRS